MPNQESYFLKRIPQSQLRKGERVESKAEHMIDLTLSKLAVTDKDEKKAIKNKIIEEGDKVIKALFPDDMHDEIRQSNYLEPILKQLGL